MLLAESDTRPLLNQDHAGSPYKVSPEFSQAGFGSKAISVEDAVEHLGFGRFQYALMFLCGAVWCADAMEMMLISFLLPQVTEEWGLSPEIESTISAVTFAGILIGAYAWGVFADRVGRRLGYLATVMFTAIFGIASAFSPDIVWLIVLRGLVGIGLGGAPVAFSLFTEFVPGNKRGVTLTLLQGAFWSMGSVFEAGLAWLVLPSLGWRWLLILSTLPVAVIALFYPLLPESPRYLQASGQADEALIVLRRAAKRNRVSFPFTELTDSVSADAKGTLSMLFAPRLRKTTLLLWTIWFMNVFVYYGLVLVTPDFFKTEDGDIYVGSFITAVAEFPGLLVSILLIDRLGRVKTLTILLVVCSLFTFGLMGLEKVPVWLLTIFAVVSRAGIHGAFSCTYVYTPEVYPTTLRTTGIGAASAIGRVAGIGTSYVSKVFDDISILIPIACYGTSCLLSAVAAYCLPFETTGAGLPQDVAAVGGATRREKSSKK